MSSGHKSWASSRHYPTLRSEPPRADGAAGKVTNGRRQRTVKVSRFVVNKDLPQQQPITLLPNGIPPFPVAAGSDALPVRNPFDE